MKVLVTGATGFVGRHLVPALEEAGHSLTLALRTPGSERRLPRKRNAHRIALVGELDRQTDWHEALQDADAVVHLVARAHVLGQGAEDEDAFMRVNAEGTNRLVEQAVHAGVARFVFMSSIGAVTAASDRLITLGTPCAPKSAYGRSKRAGELALMERTRGTQTSWTILRPTLVYGPGNPGNMERLVALVKRGLPLPLGGVRNRRSFVFVENLTAATVTALSHPGASDATFLVADGEDLSTAELIRRIARIAGTRTPLLAVPMPVLRGIARAADAVSSASGQSLPFGTPALDVLASSLFVDIEPLRERLGWTPAVGVDEGLRCMLAAS